MADISGQSSSAKKIVDKVADFGNRLAPLANLVPVANSALSAASLGYQLYKDARTWSREDSAFQRAVKDMDRAGLNTFNAGNVSQSASSQSTALQAWMSVKQVQQRDRELRMLEAINRQNVLKDRYGEPARRFGTVLFDGMEKGASWMWNSAKHQYKEYQKRKNYREFEEIPDWYGKK